MLNNNKMFYQICEFLIQSHSHSDLVIGLFLLTFVKKNYIYIYIYHFLNYCYDQCRRRPKCRHNYGGQLNNRLYFPKARICE